eukprot:jgi/Chlat1/7592/Chrsp63S07076
MAPWGGEVGTGAERMDAPAGDLGSGEGWAPGSSLSLTLSPKVLGSRLRSFRDDMAVLRAIWLKPASGDDHKARLESFYGPQAHAYDRFRSSFLWGRRPMLAASAARLKDAGVNGAVWVDLGGGTGENVAMMADYMPLSNFKKIYIVDLCPSLCKVAKEKAIKNNWSNVEVVEADACLFAPANGLQADLVTFSYSLTMIPPFHAAVDQAVSYLREGGFLSVADFYVSSKYDMPLRQHGTLQRWFWRCVFDTDNINLSSARREYLDYRLTRVSEYNSQGSIPYVPFLRAPWYMWIGQKPLPGQLLVAPPAEQKTETPLLFPNTFLYSVSWEDPDVDAPVMETGPGDVVLTLTSGGDNAMDLALQGAKQVVAVDMNPAQSFLLELKLQASRRLPYEDTWLMFGEGRHPNIDQIFERDLAPFLSEGARTFWASRLHYFNRGLYYYGGMGNLIWFIRILCMVCGMTGRVRQLVTAPTLEDQQKMWRSSWVTSFCRSGPRLLYSWVYTVWTVVMMNRFVMWLCAGVPRQQLELIANDKVHICDYAARALRGVAYNSHLATENHFYLVCLTGRFTKQCCPRYLQEAEHKRLMQGVADHVTVVTGRFLDVLRQRMYTKVILMDHVDWLDETAGKELASALRKHVVPGGRVIWRSASLNPPYAELIRKAGFEVTCVARNNGSGRDFLDRVNMYASFWVAHRGHKMASPQLGETLTVTLKARTD